jgi:hypothetical protein
LSSPSSPQGIQGSMALPKRAPSSPQGIHGSMALSKGESMHGVPIFFLLCHICKAWLLEFIYIYLNKDNYRYVKMSDVLLYTRFKT